MHTDYVPCKPRGHAAASDQHYPSCSFLGGCLGTIEVKVTIASTASRITGDIPIALIFGMGLLCIRLCKRALEDHAGFDVKILYFRLFLRRGIVNVLLGE